MNTTTAQIATTTDGPVYTTSMMYGYGTLAVALISLLALVGILLFPFLNGRWYDNIMQYMVGIGVGAIFSDAMLHMLPFVLGIHDAEDTHSGESNENTWKLSVVIAGVWMFYIFECVLKLWHVKCKADECEVDHRHELQLSVVTCSDDVVMNDHALAEPTDCSIHKHNSMQKDEESSNSEVSDIEKEETNQEIVCCGITPVCLLILIGDVTHNFGDGIAIGVAFSVSLSSGIGTTLAVFCHELPHEFADFALYLTHGVSKKQAILLNLLAALCGFVGLYFGLIFAKQTAAQEWLLALIAGFFIYNALVIVLPEMISHVTEKTVIIFILQNLGLVTGWGLLLVIALFEEGIETFLT